MPHLTAAQDTLSGLAPYLEIAKWALLALTIVSVGYMVWARLDDQRRLVRP